MKFILSDKPKDKYRFEVAKKMKSNYTNILTEHLLITKPNQI